MSDIETPIININQEELPQERDEFKEKYGISKKACFFIVIFTLFGIILIVTCSFDVIPVSITFKALITVLGVILSAPILYLFFHIYHYFIPPLYPTIDEMENDVETGLDP